MRVSTAWLRDYVSPKANTHQIAERLTMTLNEVDEVSTLSGLGDVHVGEILEIRAHPNADSLTVTKTKVGSKTYRIVCGAQNIAVGDKVPTALPGTTLPSGLEIAKRKIRGVVSEGMLCSARELGVGEDHRGIWLLPADAKTGLPLPKALGQDHDSFELEVLANRPDCMGHLGIAREVAAAFNTNLKEPTLKTGERQQPGRYRVKLDPGGLCSRYGLVHLTGLRNGESPDWLKRRLNAAGLRPISAIVDVTNFVMLEYGQPLHAMDAGKIDGERINVRQAKAGERLVTLDGAKHTANRDDLLIADTKKALGFAGIIGGQIAEVSAGTSAIVLECAHFDQARIRRTAKQHGLRTDASARFEKGIGEAFIGPALRRAVDLLLELCGGQLQQLSDVRHRQTRPVTVPFRPGRLESFLGVRLTPTQAKRLLQCLGFQIAGSSQAWRVTVPWWRTDVTVEEDLLEEVARTYGYDRVLTTVPRSELALPVKPALYQLSDGLRDVLAAAGLTEILTHSLVGRELLERSGFPADQLVTMANPLSADHQFLRRSMEPRHLEAIRDNLRWKNELLLFEIGTTFKQTSRRAPVQERRRLLITVASKSRSDVLAKIRGLFACVLAALRLPDESIFFVPLDERQYQTGRQFNIRHSKRTIGHLAEYGRPQTWKATQIGLLSFELDQLLPIVPDEWQALSPPNFPPINRDLSVFVPEGLTYAELVGLIRRAGGALLASVEWGGEYVKGGQRSLTVHLSFQAPDRTLTDMEVNQAMAKLTKDLSKQKITARE